VAEFEDEAVQADSTRPTEGSPQTEPN